MTSRQIEDAARKERKNEICHYEYPNGDWCLKTWTVEREGERYCGIHDPLAVAARKRRGEKQAHLRACERAVVEAADKWAAAMDWASKCPIADLYAAAEAARESAKELQSAVAAYREARK